jgi:hypothetical protein
MKTLLKWLCFAYLCVCVSACAMQRGLLYQPFTAKGASDPRAYGLSGFSDVRLKDEDGTQVDAWYDAARSG